MKSSLMKLFPWCLALCFLCWGVWSNLEWNKTNLILFYVEQYNDRIQYKYDSVIKVNQRIVSDNPLNFEVDSVGPNRVISGSNDILVLQDGNENSSVIKIKK